MKNYLFAIPFFLFLQTGSCDDDTTESNPSRDNFITFLDATNQAFGGCNVETATGDFFCTYTGGYMSGGLSYTVSISHSGLCRTATFNLSDNLDNPSDALVFMQISSSGVATETYIGSSGTVNLSDSGINSSMEFSGTVTNTETGEIEEISGYMECGL